MSLMRMVFDYLYLADNHVYMYYSYTDSIILYKEMGENHTMSYSK